MSQGTNQTTLATSNILFVQSQTYFGADSKIHAVLMKYLDKQCFQVHVALNMGTDGPSPAARSIQQIPGVQIKPTRFLPTINSHSARVIIQELFSSVLPALGSFFSLWGYARRNRIQVIHCTEKPRDVLYGFVLSRLTGARLLIHLHVKVENWISPYVRRVMHHASALVGVSEFVQESTVAMGYAKERTFFVHNAIELEEWQPVVDGTAIRKEFAIPDESPVFVSVSRLFYWKGHLALIQAFAQVVERFPAARLLIVGEDDPRGYPQGGSFVRQLKERVKELHLADHVIFTGFRSEIPQFLAASDIYAMPSFEEPFGMVFLEAMAMKKPVIALNNGGTREVVLHGCCGLLSEPEDIDQLAKDMGTLIENQALRQEMGENGRKRVEAQFLPERMARDFEQLYHRLLTR